MESDIQFCERIVISLVGEDYAQKWWTTPNKAFNGRTPSVQWLYDKNDVIQYLHKQVSGDYS